MEKQELKKQVEEFLNSNSKKYMDFWKNIGDVSGIQKGRNTKEKSKVLKNRERSSAEKQWMDNGVYGELVGQPPYQELDFEKFSFKVLKHYAEKRDKDDILKAAEVIQKEDESWRRKKLRHYFFQSLRDVESPFFDIELYLDIEDKMIEVREDVKNQLDDMKLEVLTMGYDSYSFIASKEQAETVQQMINDSLEISRLHRSSYSSAVKFYNVAMFKEGDEWLMKKTNGTEYDELKELIAERLTELDFTQAFKNIKEAKINGDYREGKLKEYTAELSEIQREVRQ